MAIRDLIERALTKLETDLSSSGDGEPQTFKWKLADVPCCPGPLGRSILIDEHGNAIEIDLTLVVRASEWLALEPSLTCINGQLYSIEDATPILVEFEKLTFRETIYRIVRVVTSPCKAYYTLHLKDPNHNG